MDHARYNRAMNWSPLLCKMQGLWTFNDFDGRQWPVFFGTKHEAEATAEKHIDAVLESIRYGQNAKFTSNDLAR